MYFFYYIPVGLNVKTRRLPWMTLGYSALCCVVFAFALRPYATPQAIYNMIYMPMDGVSITAVTATFLHFGWAHLIGNLLYLTFFGRYVEDRLGPMLFTVAYLVGGAIGNILQGQFNIHVLHQPGLGIVGASGAVSAMLGVFLVRFLRSKIDVAYWAFMPLQAFTRAGRVRIPALFALFIWILIQVVRGLIQLEGAGVQVAYVAHVAGFAWGVAFAFVTGQFKLGRIDSLRRQGDDYLAQGHPYAAQGAYIRFLAHEPRAAMVYASLARAMVMGDNEQGARKNYDRAITLLLEQGRRGEAEDVYLEAARGYRDFTLQREAHLSLAFGLERNLKPEAAVQAYESFVSRHPRHEEAPLALLRAAGLYRSALKAPHRALDIYRRVVEDHPENEWTEFAREEMVRLETSNVSLQ